MPELARSSLLLLVAVVGCAPAAEVVVPPLTTALAPAPAVVRPRFDYPVARRTADADELHGVRVADPYRWLEADSAETRQWFEAEDARARREIGKLPDAPAMVAALRPLYAHSLPLLAVRRGTTTFVRKGTKLMMQPEGGAERVVFDQVEHAEEGTVGRWFPSRDGAFVVIEQVKNGLDRRTALLVETKSARSMERLVGLENSELVWTKEGLFYAFTPADVPHAVRFGQRSVRFHVVGTDPAKDRVVVPPSNDRNAGASLNPRGVTKDGKRLVVQTVGNWQSSAFAIVDLTKREWPLVPLASPDAEVKEAIVVGDAILTLVRRRDGTGDIARIDGMGATPKVLMSAPLELLGITSMGPYAILTRAPQPGEESRGFLRREGYDATWKKRFELDTPRGMTDSLFSPGPDVPTLVVTREGLGRPAFRFELDPATGTQRTLTESQIEWPTEELQIDTLTATSKDGTRIPVTVLRRKDTPVDGTAALALYGYGGFITSAEQVFYPGWMVWPQKPGRVFAQCHMRGGVELGLAWHMAGRLRNRQKTLDDFHACLEALHAARYSTPGRTVTQGWSHGGMMVTAAALQRPDLQRVVIAQAPLEDMIRYVHFGRGGVTEYGEPEDAKDFEALLGFSPYHNVKPGVAYPSFFVTAPSADERVHPMHPRKIVAALQHASAGGEVLLKVLWGAGHHGGAKDDANAVMAEAWAFALSKMDAVPPAPAR